MKVEEFKKKHNLGECDKCCATCRHGRDLCDDGVSECVHPDLEGDSMITDMHDVCNAWERER